MTRRTRIAGNWKMNGSAAQVDEFADAIHSDGADAAADLIVCVPFVYIQRMARALAGSPVAVGGQDVAAERDPGAFTGEVHAGMLREVDASHVIVGHSERRALYGETDAVVAAKVEAAAARGLTPIACIGETLEQRETEQTQAALAGQLEALFTRCSPAARDTLWLAYEPVWAIGTGRSASPDQAQAVHAFLRARVAEYDREIARRIPLLYGGSVKPDNAGALAAGADVDGALVGGASLQADSFLGIARAMA